MHKTSARQRVAPLSVLGMRRWFCFHRSQTSKIPWCTRARPSAAPAFAAAPQRMLVEASGSTRRKPAAPPLLGRVPEWLKSQTCYFWRWRCCSCGLIRWPGSFGRFCFISYVCSEIRSSFCICFFQSFPRVHCSTPDKCSCALACYPASFNKARLPQPPIIRKKKLTRAERCVDVSSYATCWQTRQLLVATFSPLPLLYMCKTRIPANSRRTGGADVFSNVSISSCVLFTSPKRQVPPQKYQILLLLLQSLFPLLLLIRRLLLLL